jgi:hypothetical protein
LVFHSLQRTPALAAGLFQCRHRATESFQPVFRFAQQEYKRRAERSPKPSPVDKVLMGQILRDLTNTYSDTLRLTQRRMPIRHRISEQG